MNVKHKLVTETYYCINTGESNRGILASLSALIEQIYFKEPSMSYSVIRDYEGDFDGVNVYLDDEDGAKLAKVICEKYGVEFESVTSDLLKVTS